MITNSREVGKKLRRNVKPAALTVSLALSAYLVSVAMMAPHLHWLAWISFLPLFVVVRSLRPPAAMLAGEFWGGCLFLFFFFAGATPVDTLRAAVVPSPWLLAVLIVIPAVYIGLAAQPNRSIGFKLLTLALGWTLLEAVLHLHNPSGPHEGLLAGSQADGPQLHWLARLFGYVSVAFLVALTNASLVSVLSGARLSYPACRSSAGSPNIVAWLLSQVDIAIQSWALRQVYPRGPPIQVAAVS
ncbi:MAG: hypothetical protein IH987_15615 [Planctomycetes bacterium]|nr:hypothetical protein [Planctomycetota bacterium]